MLRYIATLGYGGVALISMLLVAKGDNPWIWAVILLVAPIWWFFLVGSPVQWSWGESWAFAVLGIVGYVCSEILGLQFGDYSPWTSAGAQAHLYLFWGVAGVMCLKIGGTIFSGIHHERYAVGYLQELSESVPKWHWIPGLLGVGFVAWQLFRLL